MIWFNMLPGLSGSIIQSDREKKWQRFVRGKRWFEQTIFHCNFWSLLEFHHVSELACLPSLLQNIENFQHTLFWPNFPSNIGLGHMASGPTDLSEVERDQRFFLWYVHNSHLNPWFLPKFMITTKWNQIVFTFHTRRETARGLGKVFTKKFLCQNLPQKSKQNLFWVKYCWSFQLSTLTFGRIAKT